LENNPDSKECQRNEYLHYGASVLVGYQICVHWSVHPDIPIFTANKLAIRAAKSLLDASHDLLQVRLSDLVIRIATVLFAFHEAAALHEAQVF
jgi:hypothetical protein